MDFWRIVGIVLLICAVSGLSVLFRELREDRKKQAGEKKKTGEKEKQPVKITTPARPASILPKSGSCGEKLTWRLKGDTLYIEGTGDMYLYRTNTWFPRDERIHRAVIAPGCTGIGNAAFEGCTGLTSVEIPNTVTVIRWSAFRGCKALKELVIPDSVREIGKDAFKDVPGIRYGGSAQSGDHRGAKPWSGESKRGVQVQQEKTPTEEKKQLPDMPFNLEFHFKNRRESDLLQINNALARYELQNVEFVERRGYLATETTTQVATGEKKTSYWYGLDDCILRCTPAKPGEGQVFQISTMTEEKNVEDCVLLWQENNPGRQLRYKIFLVYEQVYALILLHHEQKPGTGKREIIPRSTKPKTGTTPAPKPDPCTGNMTWRREGDTLYVEGQGEIRSFGFAKDQTLRKVVIGSGCTRIGFGAFEDCTGLTGITIPDSVRSIGNSAFAGCSSLTDILLPNGIMEIGNGLFSRCTSLTSITIPDNVTLISGLAFLGCRSLTSITIPDKVWRISWSAFNGCSGLTSIRLPESIREIGRDAFCGCSSLTSIQLPEGIICVDDCAFNGCSSLTSIHLPDGIREIGYGTFCGCGSLTGIQIPDSVTKIGRNAFAGCTSLTSLTIPKSVTKIGSDAFYEIPHIHCSGPLYAKDHWGAKDGTYEIAKRFCGRLGKDSLFWRLEDDTLYIEGQGRLRCSGNHWDADGIRHVVIASGCTAIADYVFQGHRSLETVGFPDTLQTIGERAFSGCRKLREAEIPDSVTGIGKGAFGDCSGLKRVHLPRNLTQIHDKTFCDCRSLENVQIPDSVYYIGRSAFDSVKSINNLPQSLGKHRWRRSCGTWWEQPSGIGECAFAYVGQIKDCRIPDGVWEIPENAFRWCGFTSVEIPDSVRKIGREAFSGCTKLISLTVPDHVTEIGAYAFSAVPHIIYNGPAQSEDNWGALSRNGVIGNKGE